MPAPGLFPADPLPAGRLVMRGKVRDVYAAGADQLLVVATDRISAFDVVLSPGIPGKGIVLNQMSAFWFDRLRHVVANHIVSTCHADFPQPYCDQMALAGRSSLVRKVKILPVECIVRGYIIGSGWKEYQATGRVCGIPLPSGLSQAQKLTEPIFTPSTKATVGHDENISFDSMVALVGGDLAERVRNVSLRLYNEAAAHAESRGIIIADTKFEFGTDAAGELIWADEALTPDSSRFWEASTYSTGANPPSLDKQFVRDWLEASGWDKTPPAPALPPDVVANTWKLYEEAFTRLTGQTLEIG
jgi:phosphoribosylaminoimidazole-succinocarboxamide synthase